VDFIFPGLIYPEQVEGLPWWPLALVLVSLVIINIVNNRVAPQTHYLLWAFVGSVFLLAIGLLDGNNFTDMGLGFDYLIPGLIWALTSIVLVTLVYFISSIFKKSREAFADQRIGAMSGGKLAFQALVEVPFGTVLLEEIAFRAVLFAMLARRFGVIPALIISAIIFGLWHILPSIGTHEANPALGSVVGSGRRGAVLAVLASVFTTFFAGILFGAMRIASGSVIAPMGLHWATNGLGYFFSWFLLRFRARRLRRQSGGE
jgi:membrane protease YdiL (CAAX protease family)